MDRVYPGNPEADADLIRFADTERPGFRAQTDYDDSGLGSCRFAIRVFDGDHGVFVTIARCRWHSNSADPVFGRFARRASARSQRVVEPVVSGPIACRYASAKPNALLGQASVSACGSSSTDVVSRAGWTAKGSPLLALLAHLHPRVGVFRYYTQRPSHHALFGYRIRVLRVRRIPSSEPTTLSRSTANTRSRYSRCVDCSPHIGSRINIGLSDSNRI